MDPDQVLITRLRLYYTLLAIIRLDGGLRTARGHAGYDQQPAGRAARALRGPGAGRRRAVGVLRQLALPLAKPAIMAVSVFNSLHAWTGFLFLLVLTQSRARLHPRPLVVPGEFGTNVAGLLAAVTLSILPIFALYLFGRRYLVSGLTAGFGK